MGGWAVTRIDRRSLPVAWQLPLVGRSPCTSPWWSSHRASRQRGYTATGETKHRILAAHTEKLHRPSAYPPIRLLRRLVRDHDRPQPLRRFSRHVAVRCGMAFGLHHHARAHELVVAGPDAVDGGLSPDRRSDDDLPGGELLGGPGPPEHPPPIDPLALH